VCTNDRCEPGLGCVQETLGDGTPCPDDETCTEPDQCMAGVCVEGPRLCGPEIPNGELTATKKGVVKVVCTGQPGARCLIDLVLADPAPTLARVGAAATPTGDDDVVVAEMSKRAQRKGGKRIKGKGRVKLKLKLTKVGRELLKGQTELDVVAQTTVTEPGGTMRRSRRDAVLRALRRRRG